METHSSSSSSPDIEKTNVSVNITDADPNNILVTFRETLAEHELDPNFPQQVLRSIHAVLQENPSTLDAGHLQSLMAEVQAEKELLLNDSPYPEVRAVVDNTDDPSTPVNTFRAWFLGLFFTIIGTALRQFFSLKYPGISLVSWIAQLIAYPCGTFMAWTLPTKRFRIFGHNFSFNPGPFNQKEHMLIVVMSNVSYGGLNGTPFATMMLQVLKLDMFFGMKRLGDSVGFQILLAFSTELIGYGIAGLVRRFLVYPPIMMWPSNLAQIALGKALHNDGFNGMVHGWSISRYRFFLYCFVGMFFYYWFPNYIFTALSLFNWMTWIAPHNVKLAAITGSITGLGVNPLPTFDWNAITYAFDPIATPFFALANCFAGQLFVGLCIIIPVWFSNAFNTAYFPINSNSVYDNRGNRYNVRQVLNPDFTLNVTKYEAYSPGYLSATYTVMYSAFFALYLATVVYVALYHHKEIINGFKAVWNWRNPREAYSDVHNRLMRNYKEVPEWWYLTILAVAFIMGCVCVHVYDTGMPIWGIVLALGLGLVLQIPVGIVQAITNCQLNSNVITEFIGGYIWPNRPVPNMIFKAFGTMTLAQSIQFSSDLKLGHYMKIPPRTMFTAQVIATIIGCLVALGVNDWQLANIKDICSPLQPSRYVCPGKFQLPPK